MSLVRSAERPLGVQQFHDRFRTRGAPKIFMLATAWNALARYRGRSRHGDLGGIELASDKNTTSNAELERQTLISEQRRAALLGWSLVALARIAAVERAATARTGDILALPASELRLLCSNDRLWLSGTWRPRHQLMRSTAVAVELHGDPLLSHPPHQ